MKRILYLIVCLLFALSCYAATDTLEGETVTSANTIEGVSTTDTVEGQVLKSSVDYSDITFWVNWMNGPTIATGTYTLDGSDEYSAGDTTGVLSSAAIVNASALKDGSYGLDCPGNYDYIYFNDASNTAVLPSKGIEGRIGVWIKIITWANDTAFFEVRDSDQDIANTFSFEMAGADNTHIEFSFLWTGNSATADALESTNTDAQLNTWYFVEFAWNQATPYREVFVNGADKGTSGAAMSAFEDNVKRLKVGSMEEGQDIHIARIIVSTDSTRDLNALKDTFNDPL